jgi:hypothetical protein
MAFGQRQRIVAPPQPGTSNLPYGIWVGSTYLPPFVPVVTTVVDTYSAAVAAQTEAQALLMANLIAALGILGPATPTSLKGTLAAINDNLGRIADRKKEMAKSLSDLTIALGSLSAATTIGNQIKLSIVSSTIESNNFAMAASGEKPTMPPLEKQIETAVKNGVTLNLSALTSGFLTNILNTFIANVTTWIQGTVVYTTVAVYLTKAKDAILSIEVPSLESIKNKIFGGKP